MPIDEEEPIIIDRDTATLDEWKDYKASLIDDKTGQLIGTGGFSYDGKLFSLSKSAQLNLLGADLKRNDPAFTFPVKFKTKDNRDAVSIANPADLDAFFLTALGTKRAHLDSGTALVEQIMAAADKDAVDAVVDAR